MFELERIGLNGIECLVVSFCWLLDVIARKLPSLRTFTCLEGAALEAITTEVNSTMRNYIDNC